MSPDLTSVRLEDGEEAVVGRSPDSARARERAAPEPRLVTLGSPAVSGNHLRIRNEGGRLEVVDLGSRNGTWMKLPAHSVVALNVPEEPLSISVVPGVARELDDGPPPRGRGPPTTPRSSFAESPPGSSSRT